MNDIPGHISPPYSEAARDDALFHYTSAAGLAGILSTGEMWATAYYCANDESELASGEGVLKPLFSAETYKLIEGNDPRVHTFSRRGVDIRTYADGFEKRVVAMTHSALSTYIACFCKPSGEEDFTHGLLSQWRGYGPDGGYALQFSRKRLEAAIERAHESAALNYDLRDVSYSNQNVLKDELLTFSPAFVKAYMRHLDELAEPLDFSQKTAHNPIAGLAGGPLEAFINYLAHTKNKHFAEERECRLSLVQLAGAEAEGLPVHFFNRGGLLVPYTATPRPHFNILECIDWVVIGPAPRMGARFKAVRQLVSRSRKGIFVRPSHIPYTRL